MSHQAQDFIEQIRNQGYRMTPQRQLVLDVIREKQAHMTVHEVITAVQAQAPTLNRATVYRVLDFLCDLQLVTRTEIGGRAVFELSGEQTHHHLVCRVCEYVSTLADYHFDELAAHLLAEHGFQAELNHLAISGICGQCRSSVSGEQ